MIQMKTSAMSAGLVLLLTTISASAEWRVPVKVDVDLASLVREEERQAVLILSAVAGPNLCDLSSDLKVAPKFEEKSALIEILGYDFTPGRKNVPCPAMIREARTEVSLPTTWLKPNTEKRIVFVLGSNKNTYLIKRNGFRVDLLPENAPTVLARQRGSNLTVPLGSSATILWPLNVGRLYLAGSWVADQDFRVALRAFAKANQMLPADEVHKSLQTDTPTQLWVRVSGELPPPNTGRRIGVLPGHPGVEVYLAGRSCTSRWPSNSTDSSCLEIP